MTRAAPTTLVGGLLAAPLGAALVLPAPPAAWQAMTGPAATTDPTAPLLGLVALVAWALTGWLSAGVVLALAGRLPGLLGRLAAAVAARTVPAVVRRGVGLAVGTTLALGTTGALPATAATPDARPAAAPVSATPVSLDWPAAAPAAAPAQAAVVVQPGDTLWALAERSLQAAGTSEPTAAAVAATWPSWWAANRDAVGDDPHLLLPGTPLVAPDGA